MFKNYLKPTFRNLRENNLYSSINIVHLISTCFLKLVVISIIITSPVAWLAMNKWLQQFVYRSTISWWIFLIAGGMALLIGLLTISFQAIKAALANPIESLRNE